jgi:hypothetical protein
VKITVKWQIYGRLEEMIWETTVADRHCTDVSSLNVPFVSDGTNCDASASTCTITANP